MADDRAPWPSFFYDVCAWFYWDPRKFGRVPDPDRSHGGWENVRRHLGRTEEPLNHILRILFAIGPNLLIAKLTERAIGESWLDSYYVVGSDFEPRYDLPVNSTQPDFAFDGGRHFVTMEMKVDAKTSPNQLAKYLYLHAKAEQIGPAQRHHALIYIGRESWRKLWCDGQETSVSDRLAEAVQHIPERIGIGQVPVDAESIVEMAARIRLGFLTYGDVVDALDSIRGSVSGAGWESEVAVRLLDGAISEINTRGLAQIEKSK